jgi:Recombination endonuclease VII
MNELALFAGADSSPETEYKTPAHLRERVKAWRAANPDYIRDYRQRNRRAIYITESIRKYGITRDWFEEQLLAQGQSCKTCAQPFDWADKQTKPHIDHCHATGKVRGLLCNRCNTALGLVGDSAELLQKLMEYLNCHG